MHYKSLDEVCGMDDATKKEIMESDRLVLKAVKDGKEKLLVTVVPEEKKMKVFKTTALIAGSDYELAVTDKN
jgi:hypothetical protein